MEGNANRATTGNDNAEEKPFEKTGGSRLFI